MHRTLSALPTGTNFVRLVKALILANGNEENAAAFAENQSWSDSPEVAMTLRSVSDPLDSNSSLGRYGITSDFLSLLPRASAFEKAKSKFFVTPFRTKTPHESTAPSGGWVGEAEPVGVSSAQFGSSTLLPYKLASIVVLTKELVKSSHPAAEAVMSKSLTNAVGYITDNRFLATNITEQVGRNPSSITSGASQVASTGSTAAAIQTDLGSMVAALTSWRDPIWILRLSTLTAIQARNPLLVTYQGAQPYILGLPVYVSLGSPAQITLLDAGSVVYSDGGITVDASGEATIEMDTEPVVGSQSPFTQVTTLKSFFQNGLVGIKCERFLNFKRTIDAGVVSMAVSY